MMHPGTLDSALFHGLIAIGYVERKLTSPVVPTFIQRLDILGDCLHNPGEVFDCVSTTDVTASSFDVSISRSDGHTMLQADGVVVSSLPGGESPGTDRELAHRTEWVIHVQSLSQEQVTSHCRGDLSSGNVNAQNQALDALALSHIQQTLTAIDPNTIEPGHKRLWFDWMKLHENDAVNNPLLAECETSMELGVYGEALRRLGPKIPQILQGSVDPLSMRRDGEVDVLSMLYSESRNLRCYAQIQRFVGMLVKQRPLLKVLEVGAGTASASIPVLEASKVDEQSLFARNDFTDVSSGFFESARAKLTDFAGLVTYKALDLEKPIGPQGFEEGSYDLVIACNVLHATKNVDEAVRHARSLLRPNGVLILMENTEQPLTANLIFGSFPGWWAGSEEGALSSSLMSVSQWTQKLADHGFEPNIKRLVDPGCLTSKHKQAAKPV